MFLLIYMYRRCRYTVHRFFIYIQSCYFTVSTVNDWASYLAKQKTQIQTYFFANWRSTTLFPSQITCLWPPPQKKLDVSMRTPCFWKSLWPWRFVTGRELWKDISSIGACCFDKCGWWKFFRSSIAFLSRHFWHFCCSLLFTASEGRFSKQSSQFFWFTQRSLFLARFLEYLFVAGRQQKNNYPSEVVFCTSSSNFRNNFTPSWPFTAWGKVLGLSQILCMALVWHAFAMDPWHFFLGLGCFRYWKFVPLAAGG